MARPLTTRPGPNMSSPAHPGANRYSLSVVQSPVRARMGGFGDKDRRPLDPPPVVRLDVFDAHGRPLPVEESPFYACQVTVWSEDRQTDCSIVINPATIPAQPTFPSTAIFALNQPVRTRNLLGSIAATAQQLKDLDGREALFFIFSDLAVRTEGRFVLRFAFFVLP
ncbi:hypothetical protein IWQ60_011543, partial [Tieghemiomyces parasiticus]